MKVRAASFQPEEAREEGYNVVVMFSQGKEDQGRHFLRSSVQGKAEGDITGSGPRKRGIRAVCPG